LGGGRPDQRQDARLCHLKESKLNVEVRLAAGLHTSGLRLLENPVKHPPGNVQRQNR